MTKLIVFTDAASRVVTRYLSRRLVSEKGEAAALAQEMARAKQPTYTKLPDQAAVEVPPKATDEPEVVDDSELPAARDPASRARWRIDRSREKARVIVGS